MLSTQRRVRGAGKRTLMRTGSKPVRKCHKCTLNLGERCWLYRYPRGQWRGNRRCRAMDNQPVLEEFETWRKLPDVKTRKELRREFFRSSKKAAHHDFDARGGGS